MYDQELLAAKNARRFVKFHLDCETDFTNEDCWILGRVIFVDKFNVKVSVLTKTEKAQEVWISKLHIVGTEIHV